MIQLELFADYIVIDYISGVCYDCSQSKTTKSYKRVNKQVREYRDGTKKAVCLVCEFKNNSQKITEEENRKEVEVEAGAV